MNIIIKNGRVLDPANNFDQQADIFVSGGKIVAPGTFGPDDGEVIDARDCWIMPGFIDLHVHFREPGQTYKEDIASGLAAAVRGGFTTVCTMPNTSPTVDCADLVSFQIKRAKELGLGDILPAGAITVGLAGKELAAIAEMTAAGAVGISEDGFTVKNAALQMQAMQMATGLGITVFSHCEDEDLAQCASKLAEDVIIARDILIAQATGARLHICHISTATGVQLVREAKARGANVTAEAAPHHFCLCEEDFDGADTNFKMNPPLRGKKDMEAVRAGLADGTIDAIATDHAPHHADEKARPYEAAPNGIVGLETALPLALALVEANLLTPLQLAAKLSARPAEILGIAKGNLGPGRAADITIINPDFAYIINAADFASKSANTPFGGRGVKGKVMYTIFGGEIVYDYRQID